MKESVQKRIGRCKLEISPHLVYVFNIRSWVYATYAYKARIFRRVVYKWYLFAAILYSIPKDGKYLFKNNLCIFHFFFL